MHGSLFLVVFITFLLLSSVLFPFSCTNAAILGRRVLLDSSSPPPPLIAATTEVRLSSDTAANGSPFFPNYPSTPPPPPPSTFATFPANISALVLPHSPEPKPGSRKLLIPAISAVLSAATVAGLLFFVYRRWRGQDCDFAYETKSSDSDSSHVLCPPPTLAARNTSNKLSVTGSSSEVLYLGNVVNSHSAEGDAYNGDNDPDNRRVSSAKPESPEISPLPPLSGHSFKRNNEADSSTEEEEEFYSPMASLAGTDKSSMPGYRNGSGPRLADQESRARNVAYSTCSCSSSTSASPRESVSVTISPPMSSTLPQRSDQRDSDASSDQNPQSPPLSLASSSPGRGLTNNNRCGSLRVFSFWNQNVGLPRISSASTSPDRGMIRTPDGYARSSLYSSASTSPDGVFRKVLEGSPPKWNDFYRNVQSVLLSTNSASPGRESSDKLDNSNVKVNPDPGNIPEFSGSILAPPPLRPPPPPPPPQPLQQQQPLSGQRIPVPPPLVPPSQPFVIRRAGKSLSFSGLPSCSSEAAKQPKPKIKPFGWRTAGDCRYSSFKLNEEMMATLFVANPACSNTKQRTLSFDLPMLSQENQILDPNKTQNITILLKALNVTTEDVCQALLDGDSDALGIELLESLSSMAPNTEEEQKLMAYEDDSSIKLGPAGKFLKKVLDVPLGFKRVDALLYVANFDSKVEYLKRSFGILQMACEELRSSRMFLKLLEAVLKKGNIMNVGTNCDDARAFKFDTLLKLIDVKDADGKTTLLHFALQEIIRSEGACLLETVKTSNSSMNEEEEDEEAQCSKLGLQVVGNLSSELADVNKSADMDYDVIRSNISELSQGIKKINEVLQLNEEIGSDEQRQKFRESMIRFLKTAEEEIKKIETAESAAISAVKEITEYFHGDSAKEEAHPFRIFVVVRDFLAILVQACKEFGMVRERRMLGSSHISQF